MSERPSALPTSPAELGWNVAQLRAELSSLLPGIGIEIVGSIASTNSALVEHLRGGSMGSTVGAAAGTPTVQVRRSVESQAFGRRAADVEPWLLVAEQQTAGRGRHGKVWQSSLGASLTFSLALPFEPADWGGLSLAVGVALAEALDPLDGQPPRLAIKWPNDLWLLDRDAPHDLGGRKLGGILIETVSAGARRLAVIGIGLNVLPLDVPDAETGVASLSEIDPHITAPGALARIARPLVEALRRFEREGLAAFVARFDVRDLLKGRAVTTSSPEVPRGIASGIAPDGALWIDAPSGRHAIRSGEIRVRPMVSTSAADPPSSFAQEP
jgi:BirA family biotin operon repressor/biotin-[acetyl-CoA-carboxylase] ligase